MTFVANVIILYSQYGNLGFCHNSCVTQPELVPFFIGKPVKLVNAGNHSTIVVTRTNNVYVFGDNSASQLLHTLVSSTNSNTPLKLDLNKIIAQSIPIATSKLTVDKEKMEQQEQEAVIKKLMHKNQESNHDDEENSNAIAPIITHVTAMGDMYLATQDNRVLAWGQYHKKVANRACELVHVKQIADEFKLRVKQMETMSYAVILLHASNDRIRMNLSKVNKFYNVTIEFS